MRVVSFVSTDSLSGDRGIPQADLFSKCSAGRIAVHYDKRLLLAPNPLARICG